MTSVCDSEELFATGMALCTDAEVEGENVIGEPTEAALVVWANKLGLNKNNLKVQYTRAGEAPFDSGRKMMSTVHHTANGLVQYTKGAPDVIIGKCDYYLENGKAVPMTQEYIDKILTANKAMADKALRVLACAERVWDVLPAEYDADADISTLTFSVDETAATIKYPGKALRHNASLWTIGHGFPGGFPNSLQVRKGAIRNLEICHA